MEMIKKQLEIEAVADKSRSAILFVDEQIEAVGCSMKAQLQIELAVEEIFVNISNYAYPSGTGTMLITTEISGEPPVAEITFIDHGIPYDPLSRDDPDVKLPPSERELGGLGIFLTKKNMDSVSYEYRDGCNILVMRKQLMG